MEIGVGLDASLNLSFDDQAEICQEAAELGYTNIWTPEGSGQDSFQLCAQRWAATRSVVPQGLTTGIAVSPVMYRTPVAFAMSGGTMSQVTNGRISRGSQDQNLPQAAEAQMPPLNIPSVNRGKPQARQRKLSRSSSSSEGRRRIIAP